MKKIGTNFIYVLEKGMDLTAPISMELVTAQRNYAKIAYPNFIRIDREIWKVGVQIHLRQ